MQNLLSIKSQIAFQMRTRLEPSTEMIVCDPHSPNRQLRDFLNEIDTYERIGKLRYASVLLTDATRQNAINKLVGMDAGDKAIEAHTDCIRYVLDEIVGHNPIKLDTYAFRVSKNSDEGVLIFLDSNYERLDSLGGLFIEKYREIHRRLDLSRYTYLIEDKDHTGISFSTLANLKNLAGIMRHPTIIAGCNLLSSRPSSFQLDKELRLNELVVSTADGEVDRSEFPPYLKIIGNSEVESKFQTTFYDAGNSYIFEGGKIIGISFKFDSDDENLKEQVKKTVEEKRKCWGDYHFGNFRMSMLNLIFGKAGANGILSAVSKSMYDISRDKAIVPGNHLIFWCEDEAITKEEIERVVDEKISQISSGLPIKCNATLLDAKGMAVNEVQDALAYRYNGLKAPTLKALDFLVNFVDNVNTRLIWELCSDLQLKPELQRRIRQICEISEKRRTLRDARDLIGIVRSGELGDFDNIDEWMYRNQDQIVDLGSIMRKSIATILTMRNY